MPWRLSTYHICNMQALNCACACVCVRAYCVEKCVLCFKFCISEEFLMDISPINLIETRSARLGAYGVTPGAVYVNYSLTFYTTQFLYNITYADIFDPPMTVNKIVVVQAFYACRLRARCLLGSLSRVKGRLFYQVSFQINFCENSNLGLPSIHCTMLICLCNFYV